MELLLDAVGAAALPIGGFFCLQHALTLRHQPNTTLSGWNTVALGHGTGAAACLYFASPLLRLVLGDLGWLPAAVVAALTLLIFVLQAARHAALNGCCAGPDAWPQTATLNGEDYQLLRQFVARQCDTLAPKYSFGMSLAKAWRLHNPAAEASWQDMQATREQAGKESAVTHLFHGTSEESARAIVADGFRLPSSAGMFGKGLYFADMVSKSANYCMGTSANPTAVMTLCDVALGSPYERITADPEAAEHTKAHGKDSCVGIGRTCPDPAGTRTLASGATVPMGKGGPNQYLEDNVERLKQAEGTRAPALQYNEYIVYDTAQVEMKYVVVMEMDFSIELDD